MSEPLTEADVLSEIKLAVKSLTPWIAQEILSRCHEWREQRDALAALSSWADRVTEAAKPLSGPMFGPARALLDIIASRPK